MKSVLFEKYVGLSFILILSFTSPCFASTGSDPQPKFLPNGLPVSPLTSDPNTTISQASSSLNTNSANKAPTRIIIKFKSDGNYAVTQSVQTLLEKNQAFKSATADQSDSLDRLHAKHKLHSAKAVFEDRNGIDTFQAKDHFQKRLQLIKNKFSQRTKRIAPNTAVPDLTSVYSVEISDPTDLQTAIKDFQNDPHVEYAQPDYEVKAFMTPNDPRYGELWGLAKIQANKAWDIKQGEDIIIGIVDTGIDYNHEDLSANMWRNPGEIPDNGIDDDNNGFVDDVYG